jgi:3alpha(or 20beta)-hydroxysteroid dehydrogenase
MANSSDNVFAGMSMSNKVVVVTGGARGQGAAEVVRIAEAGATVVIADVLDDEGTNLEKSLVDRRLNVTFQHLDVTSADDWVLLAEWLLSNHGEVHGLVNNAGTLSSGRVGEAQTVAEWDQVMDINVKGALLGMTNLVSLMRPGASIVNVGSSAGLTAHYRAAYTTSKWALRGLSKVAAMEFGQRNVRVNTIMPGMIDSPMTADLATEAKQAQLEATPLGRIGLVDDVAALVHFLLADYSSYICGAEIPVDGGFTSHGGVKTVSDTVRQVLANAKMPDS